MNEIEGPKSDPIIVSESPIKRSPTIGAISLALSKAQGEMTGSQKDKKNKFQGNEYSTNNAVQVVTREALSKHEIALIQPARTLSTGHVEITSLMSHSSGEWFEANLILQIIVGKGMTHNQAVGSAISYGCKYQRGAMCGVASKDADDDDSQSAIEPEVKPPTKKWVEIRKDAPNNHPPLPKQTIHDHPDWEWMRSQWDANPEMVSNLAKGDDLDKISIADISSFEPLRQGILAANAKTKKDQTYNQGTENVKKA